MAPPPLQIRRFAIDDSTWTPVTLVTKFDQLWLSYTASIKLRSDPADATSEYVCEITDGNLYRIVGGSTLLANQPVTFLQSVHGSQVVTAMTGQVQSLGGGGGNALPPLAGHDGQFLYTNGAVASWQPLDGGNF